MTIGFILINSLLTLGDGMKSMNVSSDLLLQFYVQRFLQCVIHQLSFFLNVKNKKLAITVDFKSKASSKYT